MGIKEGENRIEGSMSDPLQDFCCVLLVYKDLGKKKGRKGSMGAIVSLWAVVFISKSTFT